jgi:hypothetical protein
VVYYYTYGSVLAALSRPQQNYCSEALSVFDEVRSQFGADRDIAGIIAAGEAICADVARGNTPSNLPPDATAEPTTSGATPVATAEIPVTSTPYP